MGQIDKGVVCCLISRNNFDSITIVLDIFQADITLYKVIRTIVKEYKNYNVALLRVLLF